MSTKNLRNTKEIKNEFQKLFEKTPEEQIEHRAHMFSLIFLSEAQKAMDRRGWTRKRLAEEIGTSASYLTQLYRGDRLLNFKTLAKIEQALDLEYQISEKKNQNVRNGTLPSEIEEVDIPDISSHTDTKSMDYEKVPNNPDDQLIAA
mgnify:FL=1